MSVRDAMLSYVISLNKTNYMLNASFRPEWPFNNVYMLQLCFSRIDFTMSISLAAFVIR